MQQEQEHRSAGLERAGQRTADDGRWDPRGNGEPCLDDLLDDPIMALLWRCDQLEPAAARATVRALQALVRSRRHGGASAGVGDKARLGHKPALGPYRLSPGATMERSARPSRHLI